MKKLSITNRSYYLLSLALVFLMSFYPLFMGVQLLGEYFTAGKVDAASYPKYVIPYTPIAIALILSVILMPLAVKLCRKFALLAMSIFGTGVFLLSEILFEQVTVFSIKEGFADVGSWQTYLCTATAQVIETIEYKETIGKALTERYSPMFKLHFYLIAILIVLSVIGVVYSFGKMVRDKNYGKKKPLIIQAAAVCVYIGLCIFACFTAFYRTGEINISALSSWLMSIFFIVFGFTAGVYLGSLLYFRKLLVSRIVPAVVAAVVTFVMYVGELVLMGGVLFKFGEGFVFEPIGGCPFALIDLFVIVIAGAFTYLVLFLISDKRKGCLLQ
jgi:hypothetical protein